MKNYVEYKIFRHEIKYGTLQKEVNELLQKDEGWMPLGNVIAIVKNAPSLQTGQLVEYIQACIRISK